MSASSDPVDLSILPKEFAEAVKAIKSHLPVELQQPEWGIVCGSGLSTLGSSLVNKVEVPYSSIPGFAHSSVQGHQNSLAFGFIAEGQRQVPVVAALVDFISTKAINLRNASFQSESSNV